MKTRGTSTGPSYISWPCAIPEDTKKDLLACGETIALKAAAPIFAGKESSNGLYYLVQGFVLADIPALAKSTAWLLFKSKDWFGGTAIFDDSIYRFRYRLTPMGSAEILYFPNARLVELAERHPSIYKLLYIVTNACGNELIEALWASSAMLLEQRVAFFLLAISRKFPRLPGTKPMISIPQTTLAHVLGLSRPKLNRQLHALIHQGIIALEHKNIYILDSQLLNSRIANYVGENAAS